MLGSGTGVYQYDFLMSKIEVKVEKMRLCKLNLTSNKCKNAAKDLLVSEKEGKLIYLEICKEHMELALMCGFSKVEMPKFALDFSKLTKI
jgi:hypothetical protein